MKKNNAFTKICAAFVFVAAFAIFGMLGLTSKAKAATVPVQLYYSQRVVDSESGINHLEGYIAVQDIAFQKNVTVHYTIDNGKTWADTPATYVKQDLNNNGQEVWKFSTPSVEFGQSTTFCIKYEVNGQTYWDNNNGNNYIDTVLGKSKVYVAAYRSHKLQGGKYLSLLLDTKDAAGGIKVRYTEDGWKTYKDYSDDITYYPDYGPHALAQWTTNIPISNSTNQVQFVVINEENGVQYCDNNFGYNYTANF